MPLILVVLAATLTQAPPARAKGDVRLVVTPPAALLDTPVVIRLEGVRPSREIVLRASTVDANGRTWSSAATYRASDEGVVDTTQDAAFAGSYTGVEPMGLFWSMTPAADAGEAGRPPRTGMQDLTVPPVVPAFSRPTSGAMEVRLEALADGTPLASAVAQRLVTAADVKVTEVREGGLVGRLYEPTGPLRPAIVVLSGSNGGIQATFASVLAAHGYVAFALAYFREDGLPKDLVQIPLEYLKGGIEWLRARPSVDPERLGVLGMSRGGELVLLLGATYPEAVKAVVALAPSSVVWEGAVRDPAKRGMDAIKSGQSAWTRGGQPLPFLAKTVTTELEARIAAGERFMTIDLFAPGLRDAATVERARIRVESISAPVLLISSRADQMWPAAQMASDVAARLRSRKDARVESLTYEAAAHALADGWVPVPHGGTLGGTAKGGADAFVDYWPRVLKFLDESLRGQRSR